MDRKKDKCICGYEGEFDTLELTEMAGYSVCILKAHTSDPEHWHKGSIDLAVCPKCSTVMAIKSEQTFGK